MILLSVLGIGLSVIAVVLAYGLGFDLPKFKKKHRKIEYTDVVLYRIIAKDYGVRIAEDTMLELEEVVKIDSGLIESIHRGRIR